MWKGIETLLQHMTYQSLQLGDIQQQGSIITRIKELFVREGVDGPPISHLTSNHFTTVSDFLENTEKCEMKRLHFICLWSTEHKKIWTNIDFSIGVDRRAIFTRQSGYNALIHWFDYMIGSFAPFRYYGWSYSWTPVAFVENCGIHFNLIKSHHF